MKIGEFIKNRRRELGLDQSDIAKACGVSTPTVCQWETGEIANMKRDKIVSLSRVLNVSPLALLQEEISDDFTITAEERRLVELYRKMSKPIRSVLMTNAEALAGQFGDEGHSFMEVAK